MGNSSDVRPVWADSKWLSKSQSAKYIHADVRVLMALIDSGVIPASVGHGTSRGGAPVLRVNVEDLDRYMYSHPYVPGQSSPDEAEDAARALDVAMLAEPAPDRPADPKARAAYLRSVVSRARKGADAA